MEIITGILRDQNYSQWYEDLFASQSITAMYDYVEQVVDIFERVCGWTDILFDRGEAFTQEFFEQSFNQTEERFCLLSADTITEIADSICTALPNDGTEPATQQIEMIRHFEIARTADNRWLLIGDTPLRRVTVFSSTVPEACIELYSLLTGLPVISQNLTNAASTYRLPARIDNNIPPNSELTWRVQSLDADNQYHNIHLRTDQHYLCIGFDDYGIYDLPVGRGYVLEIGFFENRPELIYYPDINSEEGQRLGLHGAREEHRWQDDPD